MAALALCLAAAMTIAPVADAYARIGSGSSFGNRGTRTYSMPPSTATAPRSAPIPGSGFGQYGSARRPGFFSGGFGRGLLGGLLGAGLFGLLFGNGFGGGLGGGASLIGLLLQLGLLYLLFRWAMGFFGLRRPLFGAAGFGASAFRGGVGGSGLGGGAPSGASITLDPADYAAFERRLTESQTLFSAEDLNGLRRIATAEMVNHFASELSNNARQGVVNRLSDARLLQGDLSEAWREGGTDFATVAMRFSLIDVMVERASGRIVGGNATTPQMVTEVWTFTRAAGAGPDGWMLSAIQQA
jgi:predicted lipid-binding transport protein (Tim44 family)